MILRVEINRETKEITHVLDDAGGLSLGDTVKGMLNWERRYRLMRLHTAAHLIAAIMYRDYNALITGGQVDCEQAKLDFNLSLSLVILVCFGCFLCQSGLVLSFPQVY
jgi:misacylated tRNA(Ala) deacylase